ncbi:tetratricopeptide repeat protein [Bordetella bronchiseptica]|uniref:Putative membrane protein n=1 Tax=Bordetella bronchiseptica 253 TaxID=568707 RepID=A0A0C6P8Y8_BORBO|nr:tetratricopeptide repeat protein [Bordetella bronchiseptica]AOB25413.1 hypothetical protein BBB44_03610 [Bordetella bronchiseptica]AWP73639.1 hypothetical protein B7P10_03820 [Bordetella bronchiseptica]AZW20448.1 tetratricopeptide repeat-containing protein [Bordetella bronchiseptica]AZW42670.1 tetratricopeptide repeat-containing protein [Bordetella bronchiseptica]KDD23906.1 tetratricopeptide repeat protein [Bordetella bronchiseptica MBORD782]
MSLIYDALRNGPPAAGPGGPVGRGFAGAPARPARGGQLARSLAVAVVFGASLGMAGWILAADGLADGAGPARPSPPQAAPAGLPAQAARGPASDAQQLNALLRQMMANQERLESMQAELAAMAPPAAQAPAPAVGFPLPAAGAPGATLAASYAAPAARMEPPAMPAGAFIVQDKPARAGAASANAVAAMAEAFDRAAAAGDLGTARRQLDSLRAALPGESLTLLRRQAWLHMYGGNDRAAAESYRALLARLPNDENAGLNLAIIEARQGRVADARALLERLRRQHPDSRGVRALQEQIGHEQR